MKKYKIALLMNKDIAQRIISKEDLEFLKTFAYITDIDKLPEKVDEEFILSEITDADACITCWGTPRLPEEILLKAPNLKLIAHAAGSVHKLIPKSILEKGIRVTSAAPIIARDVAETVLGLMIVSLKRIWKWVSITKNGQWKDPKSLDELKVKRLYGLTVGIIGASNVGRNLIKLLKPFNVSILLYDPYINEEQALNLGVTKVSLEKLMAESDIISVHAPSLPSTRHMINKENLALLKDGAIFINTARGALVDESALIEKLKEGKIFACLDVTDPEPPAPTSPLRTLDNVILTPHIAGGQTINGRFEQGHFIVNEVYKCLTEGVLEYEITVDMIDRIA